MSIPVANPRNSLAAPKPARALALVASLGLLGGCSAVADPTAAEQVGSQQFGVVEVRVGANATVDASARFVTVREPGTADTARSLLGLAWTAPAAGTCVAPTEAAQATGAAGTQIELVDATPVSLTLHDAVDAQSTLPLESRAFPDIAGLASGVVFVSSAGTRAATTSPIRSIDVSTVGGALGNFALPDLPTDLAIVGATESDGRWSVGAAGIDVASPSNDGADPLEVRIVRAGVTMTRCTIDRGAPLHLGLDLLGGSGEVGLLVRAVRRSVIASPTFGSVETRLARELELRLEVR